MFIGWPARLLAVLFVMLAVASLIARAPAVAWQSQTSGVTSRLRGVSAVSSRVAWASGANGTVLRTTDGGQSWQSLRVAGAETLDFRDIDATSDRVAFALSIGSGESSRIYKTTDGGLHWDLQFANTEPEVFLDAMTFRDQAHGIAFSDSVDGRFVMFTTANGRSWERVPADRLPPALPGEGAFAASGTNIAMSGRAHVWIGTTAARVLRSSDGGRTWSVATTPLATGTATGIFSIAFRDQQHGVVVGGDYRKESQAIDNAAVTSDGGATWTLVKGHGLSGFRSVVAWVPGSKQSLIAIGPSGADWSSDDGRTWVPIDAAGFDTFSVARDGSVGWAAGQGGRISKLTLISSCTSPTPCASASRAPVSATRAPPTRSSPRSGRRLPARIFSSVDLPAPFSPTIACASPSAIEKVTSRSAATAPNDLSMCWNSTTGIL
jgi:photosystem II stability/assembly factor-like uncharacterized protein